jgi:hypothetical protein
MRAVRAGTLVGAALLLAAAGSCTGSSAPGMPTVTVQTFTGRLTDPSGDAVPQPSVAVSPDLVAAVIEVSGGTVDVGVALAAGTLSLSQTMCAVLFDTDENASTGSPGVDSDGSDAPVIGVDYMLTAISPRDSMRAQVLRATGPNQFTSVGSTPVLLTSPDQIRLSLPLAALGNDDGRLRFSLTCAQWISDTTASGITDYMPDSGSPPALVR